MLTLVGDGTQIALLELTRAVGVEQFLEVIDLGLELGADVGVVDKNALMGMLDNADGRFDILAESHRFVDR